MNPNSSLNKVLVARIASKQEIEKCPDMIACRYNGQQGEPMDDLALAARGPDLNHFNGKRRVVNDGQEGYEIIPAYPVYIKHGGECVVPNTPENNAYLDGLKKRSRFDTVSTPTGHVVKEVKGALPPLYVRLDSEGGEGGVGMGAMSTDELGKTAAALIAELQKRGVNLDIPAAPAAAPDLEKKPAATQKPDLAPNPVVAAAAAARVKQAVALRQELADAQYDLALATEILGSNASDADKARAQTNITHLQATIIDLEGQISALEAP